MRENKRRDSELEVIERVYETGIWEGFGSMYSIYGAETTNLINTYSGNIANLINRLTHNRVADRLKKLIKQIQELGTT